ncbi:hypothetical protein K466DRAFT_601285 [Polyporus arcularius HHB13444]|uniref:Carbohydrate-binding module family 13 protein n=1 Tax=Polyporus arcularius HHB13444 TaxID=1314778 RepID=A0A5C3P7R3_9APHY|nr:hypothetical protein K466DRAFT_601285 [Polyporus arcularius HHB13444]
MPVSIVEGSDTDCVAVRGSLSDVQPTAWAPSHGPYALRNLHGRTRLDLNTAERRLIACYSDGHREPNRKWEFVPYGDGHAIRCCYQEDGQALYLSVEGPPAKWARIVASSQPVGWHIEHAYPNETESSYFQPISKFVISLGNSGSSEDGTHVELDIWSPVYRCYMWECLPV